MNKLSLAFILIVLITGCATEPVKFEDAKQVPPERLFLYQDNNKQSKLLVTRDSGFLGSACNINFYIDGKIAGKFSTHEKATFYIDEGNHILGSENNCNIGIAETDININQNEEVRIRLYIDYGGVRVSKTAF